MTRPRPLPILGSAAALLLAGGPACAQAEFRLGDDGWQEIQAPDRAPEQRLLDDCRKLIVEGRPSKARRILDAFIDDNEFTQNPYLPAAYLLRGDAWVGKKNEYRALFDYEYVITEFPASAEFMEALERELEIAIAYVNGLRRKSFGIRYESTKLLGEELLVRVQERAPGSNLAERAGLELADFYYRQRDMRAAAEAYELFMLNFPQSEHTRLALERRIYANISRFKGPAYDASGLIEARELLDRYRVAYPASAELEGLDDALGRRLEESVAAQRLETARFYIVKKDAPSARFMLERLLRDYPTTVAAREALQIMTDRGWVAEPAADAQADSGSGAGS